LHHRHHRGIAISSIKRYMIHDTTFSRDYYRLRRTAKTRQKPEALARSESVDCGSSFTSAGQHGRATGGLAGRSFICTKVQNPS
jgi:hypothetical protein